MKKAFQLGKWIYSGLLGVALVLAALSGHKRAPWAGPLEEASPELAREQNQKPAETALAAPTKSATSFSSLAVAQKELSLALSWNELRSFPSGAYRDLIQQLAQEEFDNGQPFVLADQRALWTTVLGQGLKDYSRKIYRSPHFQGGSGYDLIHYELLLGNGRKADLLAYREKTENIQMVIGGEDLRPTRIDLYTRPVEGQWLLQSFQASGEQIQSLELNEQEVADAKEAIISLSVPLLTAGR